MVAHNFREAGEFWWIVGRERGCCWRRLLEFVFVQNSIGGVDVSMAGENHGLMRLQSAKTFINSEEGNVNNVVEGFVNAKGMRLSLC